jgi:hypothetical protein
VKKIIYLLAILLVGCRNPEIVQISPGVYLLSKADRAGIFGNSAKLKANVIQEANAFAASKGKVAVPLTSNEVPLAPGRLATFDYQFALVDPDSPEASQRRYLVPTAPVQKVETTTTNQ